MCTIRNKTVLYKYHSWLCAFNSNCKAVADPLFHYSSTYSSTPFPNPTWHLHCATGTTPPGSEWTLRLKSVFQNAQKTLTFGTKTKTDETAFPIKRGPYEINVTFQTLWHMPCNLLLVWIVTGEDSGSRGGTKKRFRNQSQVKHCFETPCSFSMRARPPEGWKTLESPFSEMISLCSDTR